MNEENKNVNIEEETAKSLEETAEKLEETNEATADSAEATVDSAEASEKPEKAKKEKKVGKKSKESAEKGEKKSGKFGEKVKDIIHKLDKKTWIIIISVVAAVLITTTVLLVVFLVDWDKKDDAPTYKVTFDTAGGSAVDPYNLHEGDKIARPANDPTKAMFRFGNWYADKDHTVIFLFDSKMPAYDITIYAGWIPEYSILITFNANGGLFEDGAAAKEKVIDKGGAVTAISEEPKYEGYIFAGWGLSADGTNPYSFGQSENDNVTLYAIWTDDPDYAYVSYYGNGKLLLRSPIRKGNVLEKAEVDTTGLVLDGWYLGADRTVTYVFGGAVNENLALYASFYTPGLVMSNGAVVDYVGTSEEIVVPDQYQGTPITKIGDYAFGSASEYFAIRTVVLPSSVTEIGEGAFYQCSALESVNLSKSVVKIGDSAFSGCVKLQSYGDITGVTEIGERAFLDCESVVAFDLSDNLTTIGAMAFADCKSITEVAIPVGVINIPDRLFAGCEKLKKVDFLASGMETMTFGKEIFVDSGVEVVIIRSKTYARFTANEANHEYRLSPFTGCDNLKIFVDGTLVNWYKNQYGNLDNGTFGDKIAEIE